MMDAQFITCFFFFILIKKSYLNRFLILFRKKVLVRASLYFCSESNNSSCEVVLPNILTTRSVRQNVWFCNLEEKYELFTLVAAAYRERFAKTNNSPETTVIASTSTAELEVFAVCLMSLCTHTHARKLSRSVAEHEC